MLGWSEALHVELRGTGVRCCALCPGPVATGWFATAHAGAAAGLAADPAGARRWPAPGSGATSANQSHVFPGLDRPGSRLAHPDRAARPRGARRDRLREAAAPPVSGRPGADQPATCTSTVRRCGPGCCTTGPTRPCTWSSSPPSSPPSSAPSPPQGLPPVEATYRFSLATTLGLTIIARPLPDPRRHRRPFRGQEAAPRRVPRLRRHRGGRDVLHPARPVGVRGAALHPGQHRGQRQLRLLRLAAAARGRPGRDGPDLHRRLRARATSAAGSSWWPASASSWRRRRSGSPRGRDSARRRRRCRPASPSS